MDSVFWQENFNQKLQIGEQQMHDEQVLTPPQRVMIIGLIKEAVTHTISNQLEDISAKKMQQIESDSKRQMEDFFKKQLSQLSGEKLNDAITLYLKKHVHDTEVELKKVSDMIKDIWSSQLPAAYVQNINEMKQRLGVLEYESKVFRNQFNEAMTKKFIEVVSDDDLQLLYVKSGLQLKEVQDALDISLSQASRLVNGHISDVQLRHQLHQLCLKKISSVYG